MQQTFVGRTAGATLTVPVLGTKISMHGLYQAIQKQHPNYARDMKQKHWQNKLNEMRYDKKSKKYVPALNDKQRDQIKKQMAQVASELSTKKTQVRNAAIGYVFPVPSLTSYGSSGGGRKTVSGVPGRGRGRPRGTLDPRYARFGGVFGYRKYLSQQRQLAREQLQRQAIAMRQARQQPQYEQQQYQQAYPQQQEQQLPPEMQGQGITPEYSQSPQEMPQQMQYQEAQVQYEPQQYQYQPQPQIVQQQPQQDEIKTVFKSAGGHPYNPVPRQGLTPTSQTINSGFVESVDAFTGRRFMKQLPRTEKWAGGQ